MREPLTYGELKVGECYALIVKEHSAIQLWRCIELAIGQDGLPWFAGFDLVYGGMPQPNRLPGASKSPITLEPYEMSGEGRHPLYAKEALIELVEELSHDRRR